MNVNVMLYCRISYIVPEIVSSFKMENYFIVINCDRKIKFSTLPVTLITELTVLILENLY